ncbi:fimbrial protein [Burkholderia diffusa]|uniref:fimbrial protein n=1 Tax=Burkholderia diffusa TaxID=488732 RepID=UPI0018C8CB58|nr:fimbrial protein [Burkholderia diffusa]
MLLLILVGVFTGTAYAANFNCLNSVGAISFNVPNGHYTVPRDTPVGTRITPFIGFQQSQSVWSCSETTNAFLGPIYKPALTDSSQTYTEGALTYEVFNTNLAGVGLIMEINSYAGTGWYPTNYTVGTVGWNFGGTYSKQGGFGNLPFGIGMNFAFVKTGAITPGQVTWSGPIANVAISERPITSISSPIIPISAVGNPTFNEAACTTQTTIPVDLKKHRVSEFTGPNSVTLQVPFSIALKNCPAGMNEIDYEIDPSTQTVDAQNAVVALDSTSTASGIGVQLLEGNGKPVALSTPLIFSGYNSSTGGDYTIPFNARYYQTGPSVSPGQANTVMTFTISYL